MNDDQSQEKGASHADAAERIGVSLLCMHCGADLRGQTNLPTCMRCGQSIAESLKLQLPALDDEGRIAEDLACRSCGYNLRMQPLDGVCPECAAPAATSAQGHYLRHASPRWVRKLAQGALYLMLTVAVIVATYIFGLIASTQMTGSNLGVGLISAVLGILTLCLTVMGAWRLTTPEPGSEFKPEGFTSRKLARWILLAIPLLFMIGIVLTLTTTPYIGGGGAGFSFRLIVILGVASMIVYTLLPLALLRHFIVLMRRVPRSGLVLFAKIEFWGGLACATMATIGYCFVMSSAFAMLPTTPGAATGPNMPTTPYATGSNAPAAGTPALSPAPASTPGLNALGYTSTTTTFSNSSGVMTTTTTSANGVTTTTATTMPAGAMPPIPGWFAAAAGAAMLGACGGMIAAIGAIVLLIMVWLALTDTARLAEAHAARAAASNLMQQ